MTCGMKGICIEKGHSTASAQSGATENHHNKRTPAASASGVVQLGGRFTGEFVHQRLDADDPVDT